MIHSALGFPALALLLSPPLLLYYYTLSPLSQPQLSFAKSCLLPAVARHPFRVSKMGMRDKTKSGLKVAKNGKLMSNLSYCTVGNLTRFVYLKSTFPQLATLWAFHQRWPWKMLGESEEWRAPPTAEEDEDEDEDEEGVMWWANSNGAKGGRDGEGDGDGDGGVGQGDLVVPLAWRGVMVIVMVRGWLVSGGFLPLGMLVQCIPLVRRKVFLHVGYGLLARNPHTTVCTRLRTKLVDGRRSYAL